MPSPVGHALGAIAIGWAVARPGATPRALAIQTGLVALLGVAPDLDFLIGRHSQESHSVGAAVIVASAVAAWRWPIAGTRARIWLVAGCAWLSHPLLDALSEDTGPPIGVMLLWPFSAVHWQTGFTVFDSIWRDWQNPATYIHDLVAIAREVLILAPVAACIWWVRARTRRPKAP